MDDGRMTSAEYRISAVVAKAMGIGRHHVVCVQYPKKRRRGNPIIVVDASKQLGHIKAEKMQRAIWFLYMFTEAGCTAVIAQTTLRGNSLWRNVIFIERPEA